MVTLPARVPVAFPPGRGGAVLSSVATIMVRITRTMMRRERLRFITGIVQGWERELKKGCGESPDVP
jgi:hypothetical protein